MSAKGIDFNTESLKSGDGIAWGGVLSAEGRRFGLVVSRFNSEYTDALRSGAVQALHKHGASNESVETAWVPGALEIPLIVERWAASGRFHALLALGCVIEGETPHADLISRQITRALSNSSLRHGVPVINEVVSTRNEAQARARCTSGREGRGWYAGCAALEMADLWARLDQAGR